MKNTLQQIFKKLNVDIEATGENTLPVFSPLDGSKIGDIHQHSAREVADIIKVTDNASWAALTLEKRAEVMRKFADTVELFEIEMQKIVTIEAGKTIKEAAGEVTNFSTVIRTNCDKALNRKLDDLGIMQRHKVYHPVGIVGLITSYNFPLAVAGWTIAPALLAGNCCIWKPSEKTSLTALAIQAIFNQTFPEYRGVLKVIIGAHETGKALVENIKIGMVSATGSVNMAQVILKVRKKLQADIAPPIMEAGGNNSVIISQNNSEENLKFALQSLLNSFLAGGGQKCTNTRRIFVHSSIYERFVGQLKTAISNFISSGNIGSETADYGYAPLIDVNAYKVFEETKEESEGEISFGARVLEDKFPNAYYVEPAIIELPTQTEIMFEECFAPLLFVVKYDSFADAITMANAPENAGLVNGIYTENRAEADEFAAKNQAGHSVINSATGTGTPAHGMGFGGNKLSGTGEILNGEDQLRPFTRSASRIAINKNIELR